MQDFRHFDYVITPSGLIKALEAGQDISVIINGEYYDLKEEKENEHESYDNRRIL